MRLLQVSSNTAIVRARLRRFPKTSLRVDPPRARGARPRRGPMPRISREWTVQKQHLFYSFFKASGLQLPLEFIVQCAPIPSRHLTTSLNIWYLVFLFVFFQIFCNDAKNVSDYWNLLITCSEIKSELSVKHNHSRSHSLHGIRLPSLSCFVLLYASYQLNEVVGLLAFQSLKGANSGKLEYD
jgi:hypothetical protein